jgi:hypothetical protein
MFDYRSYKTQIVGPKVGFNCPLLPFILCKRLLDGDNKVIRLLNMYCVAIFHKGQKADAILNPGTDYILFSLFY